MDAEAMTGDEASLLSDALDVPRASLTALSREPLGPGTVAGFRLPDGAAAYVDTSRLTVRQETGPVLDGVARVWIHPSDPHLPALAPTAFDGASAVLLRRLGIVATGMPELVGYRPGRRAVLRVPASDGAVWIKVVRPRRIERVVAAHTGLRVGGLPVPHVRGWSPEGLMVLDAAIGTAATEAAWHPDALLDAVDRLRGRLAGIRLDWPARTSIIDRLPWYLDRLRAALPSRDEQLAAIEGAVRAAPPAEESHAIHGDLHLGQLFVEGDEVTGLIDVDTAGRGAPADDAAAFIGHAVASALLTGRSGGDAARVWLLAAGAQERWVQDAQTAALVSVHLLGHALGAITGGDQERAVSLLSLADQAVAAPKRPLMPAFEGP